MFKCLECGALFDECEVSEWTESYGESFSGCPLCRGACEETESCKICSGEFLHSELNGGVCDECIDDYKRDFPVCYRVYDSEKEKVEINILLTYILDNTDIETILFNYIKNNMPDVDCSACINDDKSWFGEQLVKELKNDENTKGES